MKEALRGGTDGVSLGDDILRDRVVNIMLGMWSVLAVVLLGIMQVRAARIGWCCRDAMQVVLILSMAVITLFRNRLSVGVRASALIFSSVVLGVVGMYTLAMFAGGVFLFPLAALTMALFFRIRVVVAFSLFYTLILAGIGSGYVSGRILMRQPPDLFLTNISHWVVYLICIFAVCLIISVAVLSYRYANQRLMDDLRSNRDQLMRSNEQLQAALAEVRQLSGLLPICASCKKIRDADGLWNPVEEYIRNNSCAEFSHALCPECLDKYYANPS